MISFIRKHWVAYLVGAAIAIVLGFGISVLVGVKGSTPADERAEIVKKESNSGISSIADDTPSAQSDADSSQQ